MSAGSGSKQMELFRSDQIPPSGPSLPVLRARLAVCRTCGLRAGCRQPVFGEGNEYSPLIAFVGEAPGADEDVTGRPFVGRAGKLLDRMIEAMGMDRGQVYICNTVCCRPPENRKPEPAETEACREFLVGQLRAVRPTIVVTLGATATQVLLKSRKGIGELMGRWHEWEGLPLRPTFHPAYLLRDASKKREVWADLQAVLLKLGREIPKTSADSAG